MRFKTDVHIRIQGTTLEVYRTDRATGKSVSAFRFLDISRATPETHIRIKNLIDMARVSVNQDGVVFHRFENWSPEYEEYTTRFNHNYGSDHCGAMSYHHWTQDHVRLEAKWKQLEDKLPDVSGQEMLEYKRLTEMLGM